MNLKVPILGQYGMLLSMATDRETVEALANQIAKDRRLTRKERSALAQFVQGRRTDITIRSAMAHFGTLEPSGSTIF